MRNLKDLKACYNNPSTTKIYYYNTLQSEALKIALKYDNIVEYGINSYNVHIFTYDIVTTKNVYHFTPQYLFVNDKKVGTWITLHDYNNILNVVIKGKKFIDFIDNYE